jgi:NDP-sugar pyrophosphorylase family protein
MKAVILAGGLGERLKPFTQAIPKPLLPIGEQSLLEVQIANFVKYGVREIFIATNYKSEYIENFIGDGSRLGASVSFSREDVPLGTCGPLSLIRDKLDEPFIVMNGDILSAIDFNKLSEFAINQKSDFTVVTKNIHTPFNFGSVKSEGNRIINVEEKPDFVIEIVAGIYVMKPNLLDLIPDEKYYGIDNLISNMLSNQYPIMRYLMEEYWIDIGRIDDYTEAEKAYKSHFS